MTEPERQLAIAILSLAEDAGMPDTYWATDSRIRLACKTLWPGVEDPSRVWALDMTGL